MMQRIKRDGKIYTVKREAAAQKEAVATISSENDQIVGQARIQRKSKSAKDGEKLRA